MNLLINLANQSAAGYKAMFISVDTPCLGRRLNEFRNNFTLPDDLAFPNILSSGGDEFGASAETKESGPQAFGRISSMSPTNANSKRRHSGMGRNRTLAEVRSRRSADMAQRT